ncbi:MAG: HAD family hydrolase [Acidobacteria bacterium]|nr:HAD family hydrolase [Acidobacteriota bacterium]
MSRSHPLITTVVFDLDDTLYDCYRQRVLAAHRSACQKMLTASLRTAARQQRLSLSQLARLRLGLFHQERNLMTLDQRLCARLGWRGREAARLARLGRRAYFSYPVRRLRLFPETLPTLRRLHRRGIRIFVLTAGLLRIQRAKVRVLGLDRSPYIRAIFYTGLLRGRGKTKFLRQVLDAEPDPRRVLVVGDRPDSEIRAARELRMWTVRRRGGEFANYEPQHRLERPHFTLRRLSQIFRFGFRFGAA